jgi:hypothetical protein
MTFKEAGKPHQTNCLALRRGMPVKLARSSAVCSDPSICYFKPLHDPCGYSVEMLLVFNVLC